MSVICQIRFTLLNPVTSLINIFQDFVEIVNDNTCRDLYVCPLLYGASIIKEFVSENIIMPVSELYVYSYMMRI